MQIKIAIKRVTKEKVTFEVCYITTEETENSRKKGRTLSTAPKRITCLSYNSTDYKFSAKDEKHKLYAP